MYFVGLDIHQRSTSMEILDCNGKLVERAEWKLPWPQLADQDPDPVFSTNADDLPDTLTYRPDPDRPEEL